MRILAIAPNNINITNTRQNNRTTFLGRIPKNNNVTDVFQKSVDRVAEEKRLNKLRDTAEAFSACFYKQVYPNDVENLQQKYRSILKIKDKDEFLDTAFNELKKDYSLANVPMKLDKNYKRGKKFLNIRSAATFSPHYEEGFIKIKVDKRYSNKTLFSQLTHELRHALQALKIYQYGTKEDFKKADFEKFLDAYPDTTKSDFTALKGIISAHIDAQFDFFKNAGFKKIKRRDGGYFYMQKLLEDRKHCEIKSSKAYSESFTERDAIRTEILLMHTIKK